MLYYRLSGPELQQKYTSIIIELKDRLSKKGNTFTFFREIYTLMRESAVVAAGAGQHMPPFKAALEVRGAVFWKYYLHYSVTRTR